MPVVNNYDGTVDDEDVAKVTFEKRPNYETSPDGRTTIISGYTWYAVVSMNIAMRAIDAEIPLNTTEIAAALVASGIRDRLKTALRQKLGV